MDTVRIRKAKDGKGYKIALNGVEVGNHINAVEIRMIAGEMPQIALILTRAHIDLPEELQARVTVVETEAYGSREADIETIQ